MVALVVPNTVEVELIWTLSGVDHAVNVLHYIVPAGYVVNTDSTQQLAGEVASAFGGGAATYGANVADNYAIARLTQRDIRVANQAKLEALVGATGTNLQDPLPAMTAMVVTLRTALAGRRFRGRIYLPGWAEGTNDAQGAPLQASADAAELFMSNMESHVITSNLILLGVTSRVNLTTEQVTDTLVRDLVWDTQRRRLVPGI